MKTLVELAGATTNLLRAKVRAKKNPCPPHDYGDGRFEFCVKCGEYK